MRYGYLGELITTPIYPWAQFFTSDDYPTGSQNAISNIVTDGMAMIAPIIKSAVNALGIQPEQISISYQPGDPQLGTREKAYAQAVAKGPALKVVSSVPAAPPRPVFPENHPDFHYGPYGLRGLGEEINVAQIAKDTAIQAAQDAVIQGAAGAIGAAPVAGLVAVGVNITQNKDMLKTTAGRAQLAASLPGAAAPITAAAGAGALAACLGPIGIAASLGMALDGYFKAKSQMEVLQKEIGKLTQSLQTATDIATKDAQNLAVALVSKGIPINTAKDSAYGQRLINHYRTQAQNYKYKVSGYEAREANPALNQELYQKEKAVHDSLMAQAQAATTARVAATSPRSSVLAQQIAFNKAYYKEHGKWPPFVTASKMKKMEEEQVALAAEYAKTTVAEKNALIKKAAELGKQARKVKPDSQNTKMQKMRDWLNRFGKLDTIRMLLQASRDMRLLTDAINAAPGGLDPAQVAQTANAIAQKNPTLVAKSAATVVAQNLSPTYQAAVSRGAATPTQYAQPSGEMVAVDESYPEGDIEDVESAPAVPGEVATSEKVLAQQTITAKVVTGVAATGALMGVAYMAWRIFARE